MVREYSGDHIDLSGAKVGRDLIGKVEHHYHHPVPARKPPLGTPLGDLSPADAHTFEVHEVADPTGSDDLPLLPPYLYRPDVDDPLRAAVRDARNTSGLVLLVGGSSVGKTRACWEAVHTELPAEWRLWHPLAPTRPEALKEALRAGRIASHTVVWLNEAQLYLHDPEVLEAIQGLLADASSGPVLVLGSLWPEYWRDLLDEASTGQEGRHLLDRARDLTVPGSFTTAELRANVDLSGTDPRLLWALQEGDRGQVTQALSGALDLVRRYRHGTPAERAVLEVAMDASRLGGFTCSLPPTFLQDAAPGYLSPTERGRFPENWFTTVVENLTRRGPGTPGPLIPEPDGRKPGKKGRSRYLLPDYLEEYGRERRRHLCPPDSFWEALSGPAGRRIHALSDFAQAAEDRLLLRHADAILRNGTSQFIGETRSEILERRARLRTRAGDHATAERLATDAALSDRPGPLLELVDTADHPELTRSAFALLQLTQESDRVVEEVASRFPHASEAGKGTLAQVLDENTGPDGLRAVVELLRPLRDRAGIRLCLERIDPTMAESAEADQAAWEADLDQRIDRAVERAEDEDHEPLHELLTELSHPLYATLRGEIARRCVAVGAHEPILERSVYFRGPASPDPGDRWPPHPEFLEPLAECGDAEVLLVVARQAGWKELRDTRTRFLRLTIEASEAWSITVQIALEDLLLSGERALAERLLDSFEDDRVTELALRLRLSHGDVEGAERLAFPDGVTDVFDNSYPYEYQRLQRILIRHLRRRGDGTTAERLARRSLEQGRRSSTSFDLTELLTERGRRAEAIEVLAADAYSAEELEEIFGCLLTEPVAAEAAELLRHPKTPSRVGALLTLLAWSAKAAGDDERAEALRPYNDEFDDDALMSYLDGFVLPSSLWEQGDGRRYARREFRAMLRHLRHGTPLTLARHLASRVETTPGLVRRERWALDRPAEGRVRSVRSRASERYEGRQRIGVLLAWSSHLYRLRGDRDHAEELEESSLRVSGSGAVPILVRVHLETGDHDRIRSLLGHLGEEMVLAAEAFDRSKNSAGGRETLRHSLHRAYHLDTEEYAQRTLVHLARADALHLADGIIDSLASSSSGDSRYISDNVSPVDPLLESARPDLALAAARWLHGHRCHIDLSRAAERLEFEGDWDNAALLHSLSRDRLAVLERLAMARTAAGAGGAPGTSTPVTRLKTHVRLAEERGDHRAAERIALRAAAAGHGTVLEGVAHRRVSQREDVGRWRTVLRHGLTPDGEPNPGWCETTKESGKPRPMVVDRSGFDLAALVQADDTSRYTLLYAPYASSMLHILLPLLLSFFAPAEAEPLVLTTGAVSLVVTLILLPWLTADARRRWPLRARRLPFLLISAVAWSPAMIGVHAAAVTDRPSPARALVTVVTAPLSLTAALGFALFSTWVGTLGGAIMSLAMVYAFLALIHRIRKGRHHLYLIGLQFGR